MNSLLQEKIIIEQPMDISLEKQYSYSGNILSLAFYGLRINLLLNQQQYILPLMFIIDIQPIISNVNKNIGNSITELKIKCEGVLVYENGSPVNFRQHRFFLLSNSKILDKIFYICPRSYNLKFNYQISVPQIVNLDATNALPSYISQIINKKLEQKINKSKKNLINFLIRIGVMSCQEKSINRYRAILMSQKAKNKMHQIIDIHQDIDSIQNVFKTNQQIKKPQIKKPQIKVQIKQKQQNIKQELSIKTKSTFIEQKIRSDITQCSYIVRQKNRQRKRSCCQKQQKYKKQYYKDINIQNCPITQVENINIQQFDYGNEEQIGGYFSVRSYKATVIMNEDRQQDQQIDNQNNQQKRKIKIKTKLAIKQLNQQLKGNQKYQKKIQHQMNIIRNINKQTNKYVCSYFQLNQLQQNKQQIKQKQLSLSLSGKKCIIMENLVVSLQQILSHQLYCNYFQVVKQLLKAVQALHSNGIIHHDIKPSNVMFNSQGHLKLIDFSQSIQCWRNLENDKQNLANIGFTLPYSPLECMKVCEEGYANFKIDNYSVSMTILQVILGNMPISYPKSLIGLIKNGWLTDQFHICMRLRTNNLINNLVAPIKILCIKLLNRQSRKRLCIQSVIRYLLFLQQQFLSQLINGQY